MGKKYIIDLNPDCIEGEYLRIPARIAGEEQWLVTKAALTPYTEPDLEQVRKEGYEQGYKDMLNEVNKEVRKSAEEIHAEITEDAYKRGYDTGLADALADAKCGYENGFENGMIVAWEAARKILFNPDDGGMPAFDVNEVFGESSWKVMKDFSVSEVIEKLKAYEREQEEIKVGDEVELKCGVRPAIYMQGTKGSDEIYLLFNDGSCGLHSKSEIVRKTGRHFPDIAAVLKRMRGEQDE